MDTKQIYSIVNSAVGQAIGEDSLSAIDTVGLASVGKVVLSSSANTEAFLNTLAQRIGRTIYRFKMYENKFSDYVISDMQWGIVLQRIRCAMPEAIEDPTYSLTNGQSVDMFTVAKPSVQQKLFVTRTPYMFQITIQRKTLKEAFLSPEAMGAFIAIVFGEVRNAINLALENLGRLTLCAAMAETASDGSNMQRINLVTDYNTEYELTGDDALTASKALRSDSFLRYAIMRMNCVIDNMQDMSTLFNGAGELPTFTNKEDMKIRVLSGFKRRLETVTEYAAFHDQFVDVDGAYKTVNFWQSEKTPSSVDILVREALGGIFQLNNIVAVIHDKDAFGIYQMDEEVSTSPVNSAALYYNQFWHERQARFINTDDNFVIFTLN